MAPEGREQAVPHGATGGSTGISQEAEEGARGRQKARAVTGVSAGKARQARVDSLGLVSLWGTGAVPGCLVAGPGLI